MMISLKALMMISLKNTDKQQLNEYNLFINKKPREFELPQIVQTVQKDPA